MADRKMSELSAQTSMTGTDIMELVRAGANYKITFTNLQTSVLADHLADTADAHDASAISVLDSAAVFTATDVEAALLELYNRLPRELDYVEITSDVTISGTSSGSPTTVITGNPVTYDGSTIVLVQFFAGAVDVGAHASGSQNLYGFYVDGTLTGASQQWGQQSSETSATARGPISLFYRFTPSSGSHTFSVRAWRTNANGLVRAASADRTPAFLRVTKV